MKKLNFKIGITLIEIMIVIALIASLMTITAFSLGYIGRADVSAQALKFSSTIRYVFNLAATSNKTLQMKIDLDKQEIVVEELTVQGGLSEHELSGMTMRDSEDTNRKFREKMTNFTYDSFAKNETNPSTKNNFNRKEHLDAEDLEFASLERTKLESAFVSGDDVALQKGVYFLSVMTSHHAEEQHEGIATINFFPSGFVERSVIFIGDELAKNNQEGGVIYSIIINPLTGQTQITPGKLELDSQFFETKEDS